MALDYRITAFDTPTAQVGTVIFDPRVRRYISAGKLSLKDVDVDSMTMTVNPASPLFGRVQPMQTHIEVKLNGELIFRGRVLKPTRGMADGGAFSQSFSIESVEAYLMDTRQRQGEYHNISPKDFLAHLLEVHNAAVPSYKQFKLGNVTATDPNESLYRYTGYDTTWQTINDKLITPLGGFLRVRFEADGMYLDYLAEVGEEHPYDNPIKLGRNLKSASVDVDPTKVITRLIPLGATIQQEAADGETADANGTQPRVTIASANNGQDYIDIPELQTEFGVIEGTVEWDDVNEPKILLTKAQAWINAQTAATQSWQADVVELDEGRFAGGFKVSDSYTFLAPQINPRTLLRIKQKDIDFLNPHVPTLTIGDKSMTLTSYQRQNRATQRRALQMAQTAKAQATTAKTVATKASAEAKTAMTAATTAQTTADAASTAVAGKANQSDVDGLSDSIATANANASTALTNANSALSTAKTASTTADAANKAVNTVTATAEAANTTATQAGKDAASALTKATAANTAATKAASDAASALTTAAEAKTTATTANTTATGAATAAKTAQSTADTAKSAAATAQTAAGKAQSTIDNLQVGGTNLVDKGDIASYDGSTTVDRTYFADHGSVTVTRGATKDSGVYVFMQTSMMPNRTYTLAWSLKYVSGTLDHVYLFNPFTGIKISKAIVDGKALADPATLVGGAGAVTVNFADKAVHTFVVTFAVPADILTQAPNYKGFILQPEKNTAAAYSAVLSRVKPELGVVATDWSMSMDDIHDGIGLAQSTADTGVSNAAKAQSTAAAATKSAAAAQSTANTANTAAGKAQTTANTAQSTATKASTDSATALSTANAAKTAATTAGTNAEAASKAASKAQSTADTANSNATAAKTAASTAQSTATTANTNAGKAQTAANNAQTTANAAKSAIDAISQTVPGDQAGDLLAVSAQGLSIFAGGEAGQALTTAIKAGTPPAALVTLNGGKITPSSEMSIVVADGPIAFGANYNSGGTTGTWWGIDTQNRLAAYKTNGTVLRYIGTRALEPSQDIHTVIIEGDYTLNGAVASHENLPETTLYGTLSVRVSLSGSLITHLFIASDGNMWTEGSIDAGKTWSAWIKH